MLIILSNNNEDNYMKRFKQFVIQLKDEVEADEVVMIWCLDVYTFSPNFVKLLGESGALRSGVWFRASNLMIMMTQHNFCLLFD